MKIEYYTVQSDHPQTLDDLVNERLAQGWELQGGVSVCSIVNPYTAEEKEKTLWNTYVQAMVRRTDEQKESEGVFV
jgi:hypothetical protein